MGRIVAWTAIVITAISLGFAGAAGASQTGSTNTPSVLTCAGKVVVRPTSYVLACADANTYFDSVKWTTWGKTTATATATFVQNNCEPNCAAGKFIRFPATLKLSKPKTTRLGLLFSAISYTYETSMSTTLPLTKLP
jgi:hypothetical protein